jgi:hypothetical protein
LSNWKTAEKVDFPGFLERLSRKYKWRVGVFFGTLEKFISWQKLLESGLGILCPRPHLPSFIENFEEIFARKNPTNKR